MQCVAVLHVGGASDEVEIFQRRGSGLKGKVNYCPIVETCEKYMHIHTHLSSRHWADEICIILTPKQFET